MFLSAKELEAGKIRFALDFPPGKIDFLEDTIRQVTPLHAEGVAELLSETLGDIRVTGKASVEMECDCDRCLETLKYPVDSQFDLFYRPLAMDEAPPEKALDEDEVELGFYEGGGVELGEILREHVLLSLPMHKLCREECQGICPQCGQNRNTEFCDCEVKPQDDRWSALRDVKVNSKNQ